jgi:hypothetical protein
MKGLALVAAVSLLASTTALEARQRGRGAAATARESAAIDLTGYWVSVVVEDWKWRMVTPNKGVYEAIPLSPAGRKIADGWDPARDEAAGEQCRSYGAANIMRVPGRLRISWQEENVLRIDTDAGTQARLFQFGTAPPPRQPSWQGHSIARWEYGPGRGQGRMGSLKVVTTSLRPGYLRKNGVPYSGSTTVTEYYDINTLPNGDRWMTVTTRVDDPQYLARHYLTTSDFKKLSDAAGWNPTPCSAR